MMCRTAALCAWLLCCAGSVTAQQPAGSADRPVTIFSDILSGRGEFTTIILAARTAYRVEVIPASAVFAIRGFGLNTRPPAVTTPLENAVEAAGGATYLVIPAETGEYRLEAAASGEVRIRVIRDPREQALLEGRAPTAWRLLTLGVRAVALQGTVPDYVATDLRDLRGWEVCVGVVEGAVPFARRLGGCVFTYARLEASDGRRLGLYGFAPRYRLAGGRATAVDLAIDVGLGRRMESVVFGLNFRAAVAGPLILEVSPGYAWVRRDGDDQPGGFSQIPAATRTIPRLAAGARLHF